MRSIAWAVVAVTAVASPCLGQLSEPRTHFDGPSRVEVPAGVTTVPLEKQGQFYFVQVRVGGKPFRFTVETGANHVAVSRDLVEQLGLSVDTLTTRFGTGPVVRLPVLEIGSAVFHDVVARVTPGFGQEPAFQGLISIPLLNGVVVSSDFPQRELRLGGPVPTGAATSISYQPGERVSLPIVVGVVLGLPILEQFVLTLDLANERAALTMPVGARLTLAGEEAATTAPGRRVIQPADLPTVYLGFGLVPQSDSGKIVTALAPGSSAANGGLRDGDQIISVDGVTAERVDRSVLREAAAKGVAIEVVVRRDGKRLEFDILPQARR
ncbi:MAG: aspartyl protease family protein [Gemmatimonadota bacterium]